MPSDVLKKGGQRRFCDIVGFFLHSRVHVCHLLIEYKTDFSFPNNLKNLDPFYKSDVDSRGCFGRGHQ